MTILVTGVTGTIGKLVLNSLTAQGLAVRATSSHPESAHVPDGVELIPASLTDTDSLRPALQGVEAAFLYASAGTGAAEEMVAAGVRSAVLVSSLSVSANDAEPSFIAARHAAAEDALMSVELDWTILRPGAFATNTLNWAGSVRESGAVFAPYPDAYVEPIHEADIADAAVAALTSGEHRNMIYDLTGPESITQREQVESIGRALGRSIRFEELSHAEARKGMSAVMPATVADTLLNYLAGAVGRPGKTDATATAVTGRPARTYQTWANEHAEAFR